MRSALRFVVLALTLAACGGHSETPSSSSSAGSEAYAGPIGSTDTALGSQIFGTTCNDCHPGGQRGYGPALAGKAFSTSLVRQTVREGHGRMPSFSTSELSDAQLEAVLAHLATIGAVASTEATPVAQ